MLLCQWNGTSEACYLQQGRRSTTWCICRGDFNYSLANLPDHKDNTCNAEPNENCDPTDGQPLEPPELPEAFLSSLKEVNTTEQIKDLWRKLKMSNTKDLRDVERFFIPSVSVADDYGFPADSFILSCSYGMLECWDLVTLYTASYGKCYMFNYVGDEVVRKTKIRTTTQSGKLYGLQLFMRARSDDSLPLLTRQLGVRIIIHDPRSLPVTAENGIDLRPGDMTSIDMRYTEINRLGQPWGKCANDGQQLGDYSGNPYRQNDCERECINMEVFRKCNCYHPKFLRASTVPRRGNICLTNLTSGEDHCFIETVSANDKGEIKCNCPPSCREKVYETSMSTSKLNEEFFKLVKMAKSLTMINGTPAVTNGDFESSLMGVQIYYNSMFVTSINETAIYSWESLIANIGGNMGLFLGLSLVTLLEIAEFFADMIYKAIVSRRSQAQKVNDIMVVYR